MQGVEILDTIHEYAGLISPFWAVWFFILALLLCIAALCTIDYDTIQQILIFTIKIALFGGVVCLLCSVINTDEIIDTEYKVTISDEVSMTEFYEKYEVVEQSGKIFTVKERD